MIGLACELPDPTFRVTVHAAGKPQARLDTRRQEPHRSDCSLVCWRSDTVSSGSSSYG
jgi:hypothetical protein